MFGGFYTWFCLKMFFFEFQAMLRMDRYLSYEQRMARVDEVITEVSNMIDQ